MPSLSSFTNYTIVPEDGVVVLDGDAAFGVDMTGIPSTVHAIQWKGAQSSGSIEYKVDPETGELPAPGTFSSASTYSAQTTEAQAIITAQQNPDTYYSTSDNNTYQGQTYSLGSAIVITTPDTPQPPNTTTDIPPTPESFQQLYWFGDAWVLSSFDPTLSLLSAKTYLDSAIEASSAAQGNNQARIYSSTQLFAAANVSVLPTADYSGTDLGAYQILLDAEVANLKATVAAATTTTALYNFDPTVSVTP